MRGFVVDLAACTCYNRFVPKRWFALIIAVFLGIAMYMAAFLFHLTYEKYGLIKDGILLETDVLSPQKWMIFFMMTIFIFLFIHYRFNPRIAMNRIRSMSALDEMEAIVGRAAELGKSVLFAFGQLSINAMSNVASVEYIRGLARHCARNSVKLVVIAREGAILAAAREVIKWAYELEGKPEDYNADNIYLLSPVQFSFAISASAMMFRDKPAAVFCFGYFRAESLILLESARASGAIVVSGTDEPTQMPFLITSSHHRLFGEELYAAGALAGDSPVLRAIVRVQDLWRTMALGLLFSGAILKCIAVLTIHTTWGISLNEFLSNLY
jgi:hypothetical protein